MNICETEIKKICEWKNIFLAFSGGPDSRALLDIFENIFWNKIILLHFNHKYRAISDEEEEIIKKKFSRFKIFCQNYSWIHNEKNWRQARYSFFSSIMKKYKNPILILWHNLDDRIETSFLNMLKWSWITWFLNMKKVSKHFLLENALVYRPLLETRKKEILDYLKSNQLDYFIDESNFNENISIRNYIRKNIILPSYKQNKNFFTNWKNDYKILETIKMPNFEKTILKLPNTFENKNIKIDKYNFPKTPFETYILMKDIWFWKSINHDNVNILYSLISKRRWLFEIWNYFIYVNNIWLYFLNSNIKEILNLSPKKIDESIFAKYEKLDNINYRYTQSWDKYKSKTINKRAINKKIPIFLRKFIVVWEKGWKIIYCDMPYEY